ncbi:putative HTH-type transcriptional regulator [Vibrio ruber DSM 16370]|uniref:Putative HTH-type transcriptional regulator n=1 Tax=Vibrio ruber (strain DSM 16370 / JCM 11486 / BCRC 17186 / CECT 7878 / LMG 23124 / VR1) TaxID=1123498 RepID=A0A1R4LQ95_VIBR1|nr:S24 family peptidase [Vibrio ruber]SJN58772.1 putative HTH-type transcriptional regulator [Vibrio ruber DSM 16370]
MIVELGERLKARRESLGLTQDMLTARVKEIDSSLSLNRITISQIENGIQSSMKDRLLLAMSKALECSPEWIVYGTNSANTDLSDSPSQANVSNGPSVSTMCPVISWVKAGDFSEAVTPYAPDEYEYYPCPVHSGPGTYILRVRGDSMEPRFEENDLIFIDPNLVEPEHNKFVIAMLTDSAEATFKQIQVIDNKKYLKALNPSYPPELRFLSINGNCQIIGTVIAHMKPI